MSDELQAALRVGEWLHEFDHMRGLDPEVIHTANYSPLLASDLRLLIAPHITAMPADQFDALARSLDEPGEPSSAARQEKP